MRFFKELLYGKNYPNYFIYDTTLRFFDNSEFISYDMLFSPSAPHNLDKVFDFLEAEKLVEKQRNGISITEKGILKRNSGGFKRVILIKRLQFFAFAIGLLTAIVSIIFSLFNFF